LLKFGESTLNRKRHPSYRGSREAQAHGELAAVPLLKEGLKLAGIGQGNCSVGKSVQSLPLPRQARRAPQGDKRGNRRRHFKRAFYYTVHKIVPNHCPVSLSRFLQECPQTIFERSQGPTGIGLTVQMQKTNTREPTDRA
jgi:hypothetical protein